MDGKTSTKTDVSSAGATEAISGPARQPEIALPPLACAECKLGRFAIYGPTRETTPSEIYTRRRSVLTIQAGKTFLREGERFNESYTLYSGWAFRFKQLPDGRRQILSFLVPGDSVMLECLCFPELPLPFSVKSLTPLAACTFTLRDMVSLTSAEGVQAQHFAKAMRDHLVSLNQRLMDIGRKSALGRVSQLILELEGRLRQRGLSINGGFEFPVRQEHLADALGLTTVYINRTLDRLRKLDLIEFKRNWMMINDVPALARIAEAE